MKKLIALFLILTMAVSFAACAKAPTEEPAENNAVTETPETPEETTETPEETPEEPEEIPEETPEAPETAGEEQNNEDLLALLEQLVDGVNEEMVVMNTEIPAENYEYVLFIPYVEGSRAVVSEPMIGSIAHSVALLELPEDADAEAVAAEIEANMDPRKWICVEAEATAVKTSGRYVLMVMSNQENADAILANFDAVFGA